MIKWTVARGLLGGMAALSATACHDVGNAMMTHLHGHSAQSANMTVNMQGDAKSWIADPHVHAFYDLAREACANGADKVDLPAFEKASFAIFRDFGRSRGMPPEAMQEHLATIPRQVIEIARQDPSTLSSYANFTRAVFGPD